MATLRDPLFRTSTVSDADMEAVNATAMNPITRAYHSGRIGTDINSLAAQEVGQRAAGEAAAADANRAQITALQQQQAAYAPRVGRVEDIGGVGDAASWFGTQVGQGVASMQDPVALSAGLNVAGNVAGFIPHPIAQAASKGLKVAAPLAAYGLNQRQMTGEFYNNIRDDQDVMSRYTPQQLADTSNTYGAAAGLIDTAVPGLIGHQLGGGFLRRGLSGSVGGKTLTSMGMEGGTELVQDYTAKQVHSDLNPNRDTSGDASSYLNSFAGGFAGAGPFSLAGAAAEQGSRRVGHTANVVGEKAGEVIDLAGKAAAPYVEKGKDKLGKVVDMFRNEDGDVTAKSVKDKVTGTAQDLKSKLGEHELMKGMPPADVVDDEAKFNAWFTENEPKRRDAVLNRLADLADTGDEKATDLYTRFGQVKTQGEQDQIINEGADHVLGQNEWTELEKQAQAHAAQAGRLVNKFGSMLGKGVRAAGGAAMDLGKAAVSGFKGDKKNMQIDPFEQVLADQALEGGKKYVDGLKGLDEAQQRSYNRAKIVSEFLAEEAKTAMAMPANRMPSKSPEAMTNFMKDIGLEIADLSENWITPRPNKAKTGNAPTGPASTLKQSADSRGQQYDGLQFSMNRIVNSLRVMYKDRAGDVINELQSMVDPKAAPMFDVMREELDAQVSPSGMRHTAKARATAQDALIGALGQETEAKLIDQGVNLRTQDGKESLLKMVEAVDRGIAPPHAVKALEDLIGKENLLNLRRTIRPQQASRDDLMEDDGETLGEGLEVDGDSGEVSVAGQSGFDKRQAEKKVDRTSAARMYGFKGTGTVRTSEGAKRDPFAPEGRITYQDTLKAEDEMIQRLAAGEEYELPKGLRRPTLTKKGEKTFDGRDAGDVARDRLSKLIGGESNERLVRTLLESGDPKEVKAGEQAQAALAELAAARKAKDAGRATAIETKLGQWRQRMFGDQSRGGEWDVQTRNVLEVLKEEGADDLRILSLYRDYARMEMAASKSPDERAKLQNIIALLRPAIVDQVDGKKGGTAAPHLSPAEHSNMMRLAERYFGERTMAVAEQHTDRAPEKISAGQVTTMASFGKAATEFARKIENTQGKQAANEYIADRNLIQFAGNDGKPFHIPAGRLVLWGKKELGQYFEPAKADKYDNYTRNLEYLGALTLGINAVRESGMVALTKTGEGKYAPGSVSIADKFGRQQAFRADTKPEKGSKEFGDLFNGLPDGLMLATTNVFGFKKMMASQKIKPTTEAQDLLTKLREWNDESFVSAQDESAEGVAPEQLWGTLSGAMAAAGTTRLTPDNDMSRSVNQTQRVSVVKGETRTTEGNEPPEAGGFTELPDGSTTVARRSRIKPLEKATARSYKSTNDGGFDDKGKYQPGATPSDFDGQNPERTELAKTNRETGFDAAAIPAGLGTERRIDAGKKAAERGQQLVDALDSNFDDGMKSLASRMRMAKAPAFNANDPNTVRGGAHYALPVLEALSDENLSNLDIDADQASQLIALRKEAQALVAGSDLSNTVKAAYVEGFTPPAKATKDMSPRQLIDAAVALDKATTANSDKPALKGRLAVKALGTIDEQEANAAKIHEMRERYASVKGEMTEKQRGMMDVLFRRMAQSHETFMPKTSAKEVGAGLGKPSGAAKVKLTGKSPYLSKDQDKSDRANKFIGRGSDASSTAQYAKNWGDRANTGSYAAGDTVFVSAEGNRGGRVAPDLAEIDKAIKAGATLITDSKANRSRPYNVGEREVADHLAKRGYVETGPGVWVGALPSRTGYIGGVIAANLMGTSVPAFTAAKQAVEAFRALTDGGLSLSDALAHKDVTDNLAMLASMKLQGFEHADLAYAEFVNNIDQLSSLRGDPDATDAINARLAAGPSTLSDMMKEIIVSTLPEQFKAIARAVKSVAGSTPVVSGDPVGDGQFTMSTGKITQREDLPGAASTVLHEGVHAATIAGVLKDENLHQAVYDLMEHIANHDKSIASAYGMTNSMEFLAEGMSNEKFQQKLMAIPASKKVEKYLGATLANAWDAFVGLVRTALGLKSGQENALSQLLELGGRAMRATGKSGDVTVQQPVRDAAIGRQVRDANEINQTIVDVVDHAGVSDYMRKPLQKRLMLEVYNLGDNTHLSGVFLETIKGVLDRGYRLSDGARMVGLIDTVLASLSTNKYPSMVGAKFNKQGNDHPAVSELRAMRAEAEQLTLKVIEAEKELRVAESGNPDEPSRAEYYPDRQGRKNSLEAAKTPKLKALTQKYFDVLDKLLAHEDAVQDFYKANEDALSRAPGAMGRFIEALKDMPNNKAGSLLGINRELMQQMFDNRGDAAWRQREIEGRERRLAGYGKKHTNPQTEPNFMKVIRKELELLKANDLQGMIDEAAKGFTNEYRYAWPAPKLDAVKPAEKSAPSPQPKAGKTSTQAERDAAVAEIVKTLGKDIGVRFEQTTGFSGAYLDKEAAIVISLTPAAGTMQTAYHEALHAFVAKLVRGNDKAKRVLDALANHGPTMERVMALLDGYPEAQAQLKDGEERIAYIYQFWRAGLLDLPTPEAQTMLQKLVKFFRAVLGRVSDLERGDDLLRAFARGSYAGEPSVAGKVMAKHLSEGAWGAKTLRKMDGLVQHVAALTMPAHSVLATSKSKTAQKLSTQLWTNPGEGEDGDKGEGYLNARERMARRYSNEFSRIMAAATERDHADVINYLQKETDPATIAYAPHREAVEKVRGLLQRFRKYMVEERGMNIGDRGPLYFPRVWSVANLQTNRDAFIKMMTKEYPMYNAEGVYNALIKRYSVEEMGVGEGLVDDDAVLKPTQGAGHERILDVITGEHAAPFLEKSLVGTLTRYFHEGARAAEYTHRFGQKGEALAATLGQINQELRVEAHKMRKDGVLKDQDAETKWVDRQMRDIRRSVDAMEGTLGRDIGDGWRKANSWMTVYQNVRLLPLSLFSNVVDPLGMVARGAPMKEAFDAFLQGMREVFKNWKEMITGKESEARMPDEWERLAMAVGSVDAAVFNHHVSDEYASAFMSPGARKINDFFFKANGMESWNKGMRVAATRSAVNFILRHKSGPETHSMRWLEEIGLTPGDIHVDPEGRLITDKHTLAAQLGITKEQAAGKVERVHMAINRWVQGAIITPNAAQRPAWSSDPHWSMFFHLKQFSYSFHQTIMKRAVNELEYGNIAPMGAFIWYVPVMIASDLLRGLVQGGGDLPSHMQGMTAGDHVLRGIERSGLFSVGQIGVDASGDLASLGGPAVEQIIDGMRDPLERTMIKAAPAHGLYAEALR